jgi:hypothetical protein
LTHSTFAAFGVGRPVNTDAPSMKASLNASVPTMSSEKSDEIASYLAHHAGATADARQVGESVSARCREIEDALTPIVGRRGVAALLNRSVQVAGQTHAWLNGLEPGLPVAIDLQALAALFARQSPAEAAAGGGLLLHTFHALLASLIGASLTERLLRSVWASFLSSRSMDALP